MRRPDRDRAVRWFDGVWKMSDGLPAIALSPDVLAGVGMFETFGVRDGAALDVEAHLDRLERSAAGFEIGLCARRDLRDAVVSTAIEDRAAHGWVKLVVYRNGPTVVFGGAIDRSAHGAPCTAIVLPWVRHAAGPVVGIKSTSWAVESRGLAEAARRGVDEGIWRNQRGHLTEACTANLFLVRGRRLFTAAPRDGLLPGITRGHALTSARSLGMTVHEGKLRRRRLEDAEEAFLTSSVRGVRPLVEVDGRPVGSGRPGPATARIASAVERLRVPDRTLGEALDGAGASS